MMSSPGIIHRDSKRKSGVNLRARYVMTVFLFAVINGVRLFAQGPPFQVDDPVPVDFKHYEFYIFGGADGTPAEMDYSGPAFEFNWGAVPAFSFMQFCPGVA
jgi:hypothetical protein